MSQDAGLFTVRRPRETLGGINYNTSIPQPASAVKRSSSVSNLKDPQPLQSSQHARSISSSRMSLAPGRPQQPSFQRSSSGSNLVDLGRPATVQRNSSSHIFGSAIPSTSTARRTLSYAPGSASQHQAPMSASQSVQRRSSVYSRPSSTGPMVHQSFFVQAPIPAGVPRDPRPLKDRTYQAKIGQELLDYLTHNNFELDMKHSLGQNTLKSPTQKDFNFIFQWLYHRIDPAYRFQKNIDAEVPPILKQLRYPYEKSITKSQIAAVGGQNWSTFLGMLHWMMQLAQMLDRYEAGEYDDACAEAGVDVTGDRIIFRFLSGAYRDWLQVEDGDDEDDADKLLVPHVEAMAADFEKGNARYAEEMKILEAENSALKAQIEEAEKGAPDLAKLDKHFQILEDDKRKFEEYNANVEGKVEKYEHRIKILSDEIERTEAELREAEQEKGDLQGSVDRQGITIQDIDRMNSERERLAKSVEVTAIRLEEIKKKVAEKELDAGRKLEDLERAVDRYNSLCYQIGLIPASAVNAKGGEYELRLITDGSPNFSTSQMGVPVTGYHPNLDLRQLVKSHFISLRKEISERRSVAIDADMKNHELLDSIKEAIDDKRSEVEALEHRVRAAEEEFEKTKEVTTTQKLASDAQIEKMEKELAKMRAGLTESVQLMEQREMNTNIEYEQLTLRANALREELHTEIEKMLNDIIKFKVHIQKSLEDYEGFVVEEVEQELGGEGEMQEESLRVEE
ncbi:hec ndc80p family protein [Lasallia pustulata]|uniref:Kinetochore protein NDC80 n=1 Tax=Lasallia pustulata TaxID=136370 RepID=A0A1W5CUI1_9LECA|nr:hec ndc80p family protein [Lasallia pustulata]